MDKLNLKLEFGSIVNIGGGDNPPVIEPLNVSENGTYSTPSGVDGFNPVTVELPPPVVEPLEVTENGTYTVPEGVDGYSPVTVDVPAPTGWQPQPDWWDIKAIFEADPDPNLKAIFLISNTTKTTKLNCFVGTNVVTSDGAAYSDLTLTHTWDESKDKPCSIGYKTRLVKVYNSGGAAGVNSGYTTTSDITSGNIIYAYFGRGAIVSNLVFQAGTTINRLLECVQFDDSVKLYAGSDYSCLIMLSNCSALKELKLPDFEKIPTQAPYYYIFTPCNSLRALELPKNYNVFPTLQQNNALTSIFIHKTVTNLTNLITNMAGLVKIDIEDDWVAPPINISQSFHFPESSAIDLFTKLGATQTPVTLTFGATLLNRWSQTTKDIAINKGYTLA